MSTQKAIARTGIAILTTLAVTAQTPQTCTPPPAGMVAWWPGDGNASDIVGGHNGTLVGNVAFNTRGEVGKDFYFTGQRSHVDFGNSIGNFGTSDFTVDFWFKTSSSQIIQAIIGKRDVCNYTNFWEFRTGPRPGYTDADITFELGSDFNNYALIRGTHQANDGQFHHIAAVRMGTLVSLYFDGQLDGTTTSPSVINMANAVSLIAGNSVCTDIDGTVSLNGQIDEIELFTRALAPSEIQALYAAGSYGKCKGTQVSIEIHTGTDNPNAITVAILGSPTFNAITVQNLSVSLGGYPVKTVGNNFALCSNMDINTDGIPDKVCAINVGSSPNLQPGMTMVMQATTPSGSVWGVGTLP